VDRHGRVALQVAKLGVGSVVHQQPLFLFVFLRHLVRNKRLARVPARQKALPSLSGAVRIRLKPDGVQEVHRDEYVLHVGSLLAAVTAQRDCCAVRKRLLRENVPCQERGDGRSSTVLAKAGNRKRLRAQQTGCCTKHGTGVLVVWNTWPMLFSSTWMYLRERSLNRSSEEIRNHRDERAVPRATAGTAFEHIELCLKVVQSK